MNSSKPYLLRALYEWIVDNDCTPHLVVSTEQEGVRVPPGLAKDGSIVLNVAPSAIRNLLMDDLHVSFDARFGGQPFAVLVPVSAVSGIYARENGEGMAFEVGAEPSPPHDPSPPAPEPPASPRPSLRVVK